jgi:tRNA-splicing ligase RtcB
MFDLEKMDSSLYILNKKGNMKVPGLIVANESILKQTDMQKCFEQIQNVACLPGILGHSIAMPDLHWGYGFPIGGVAAMDIETGVISPGGVGYDINCGVRLAIVPVLFNSITERQKNQILNEIFESIPSGRGEGRKDLILSDADFSDLTQKGAKWAIEKGFGIENDLECIESFGILDGADLSCVSKQAIQRARSQLGTIGSGNHFVEIGQVGEIFCSEISRKWDVDLGMTYILIHTGSRGFGHQICQDYLNDFIKKGFHHNLPDRQLVCAPIKSEDGKRYFAAMAAAANFAFNNRQIVLHHVRKAFETVLSINYEKIHLIYDVCHNIAKFEEHIVDGKKRHLCVHRKGATRAFGPGSNELCEKYRKTGQPVLVPGDMGRASHLMAGLGNALTFCSCCHGAGRLQSRIKAKKAWEGKEVFEYMKSKNVHVLAHTKDTITEEMPDAYKNVDDVVNAAQEAKLAKKVARLIPALVLKG